MNTTAEAKDTVTKVAESCRATIAYCKGELAAQILDGTPFLLVITTDSGDRVYGQWSEPGSEQKVKGYVAIEIVPDHLCGTVCFGEQSVEKNIKAMTASGTYKARKMHRREFLKLRLAASENLLKSIAHLEPHSVASL